MMLRDVQVKQIKYTYLKGMRVRLIRMDDFQAPPIGTEGTVRGVDDTGAILVNWDTGSSLNVIPEQNSVEII